MTVVEELKKTKRFWKRKPSHSACTEPGVIQTKGHFGKKESSILGRPTNRLPHTSKTQLKKTKTNKVPHKIKKKKKKQKRGGAKTRQKKHVGTNLNTEKQTQYAKT